MTDRLHLIHTTYTSLLCFRLCFAASDSSVTDLLAKRIAAAYYYPRRSPPGIQIQPARPSLPQNSSERTETKIDQADLGKCQPRTMPARAGNGRQSSSRHRSTLSLQKTEILINVYDLLPVSLYLSARGGASKLTSPRSRAASRRCCGLWEPRFSIRAS